MINSSSINVYPIRNENFDDLIISSNSNLKQYYSNGQILNSFYPKANYKKYRSNKVTIFKFNTKNVPINPLEISDSSNNNAYSIQKYATHHKKDYSQDIGNSINDYSQQLYNSENENINVINMNNSSNNIMGKNDYEMKPTNQIMNKDFNNYYPSKTKYIKSPNGFYPVFSKKNILIRIKLMKMKI